MTSKFSTIILFLIFSLSTGAQDLKIFTLPEAQDADTLNFCLDSNIIFIARQSDSSALETNTYFEWQYGNKISESGINTDSVANVYSESGGYFIQLKTISPNKDTLFASKYIRIAFSPYFSGTVSSADTASICYDGKNNDIIDLSAQVEYPLWKYEYPNIIEEETEFEIKNGLPFTSKLTHEIYSPNNKIVNKENIDTIGILLEHSNAQDIEIQLICPSGKLITLKNTGTKKTFMGEPVDNEALDSIKGNAYWYYFTEKIPNYGTMEQEEQQYFNSFVDNADSSYTNEPYYPTGSYLPNESFSNLVGCPYNGNWSIAVIDNNDIDNGYIKAWKLILDSIPPLKEFKNSAQKYQWKSSVSGYFLEDSMQLQTTAEPLLGDAIIKFNFYSHDNYGCIADTAIIIEVQTASFTASPSTGDAELEVSFTNTTSWKDGTYYWDFGDGNNAYDETNIQNIYLDKGEYESILTATSKFGCINKDTITIIVTAPVSSIDAPNVFTPNNDGINDRMKISFEGLRSGELIIYSRWGEKIAKLKNIDEMEQGWDGTLGNNGNKIVKTGIYYYIIIAEGKDDQKHKINGTIHVFSDR